MQIATPPDAIQRIMKLPPILLQNRYDERQQLLCWDTHSAHAALTDAQSDQSVRSTERILQKSHLLPQALKVDDLVDEFGRAPIRTIRAELEEDAKRKRHQSLVLQMTDDPVPVIMANDGRFGRRWAYGDPKPTNGRDLATYLVALAAGKPTLFWPHGEVTKFARQLVSDEGTHSFKLPDGTPVRIASGAYPDQPAEPRPTARSAPKRTHATLTHLDRLEAESIHIMREVVAQAEKPVMLYSIGKDSSVMLHLARKAFHPAPPPFPLLHVDTRWKFRAMYEFRDSMAKEAGMELICHINPEGIEKNINPFDHGSALHTDVMKTQGLKQALNEHAFDVAFGGARRDEEKSRAKERVFSFRTPEHRWDPKNQRPELWRLYNGYKRPGESIRVFPLSNWTELDIWQYIYREGIPIVPLYFAAERPVVARDGTLIMIDDDRFPLTHGEHIEFRRVRFRTLGCYPLTGAFESDADDLASIVLELLKSRTSERQGRTIDTDSTASMEKKKQEGYF